MDRWIHDLSDRSTYNVIWWTPAQKLLILTSIKNVRCLFRDTLWLIIQQYHRLFVWDSWYDRDCGVLSSWNDLINPFFYSPWYESPILNHYVCGAVLKKVVRWNEDTWSLNQAGKHEDPTWKSWIKSITNQWKILSPKSRRKEGSKDLLWSTANMRLCLSKWKTSEERTSF